MRIAFHNLFMVLLISVFAFCSDVFAAQRAVVDVRRAVIYADLNRQSPIGYVTRGKQLLVGNVKRRNKSMLPVMVNGQVAWIKVNDIYLPEENREFDEKRSITEHEVLIEDKIKDPFNENNFLTVKVSPSSLVMGGILDDADNGTSSLSSKLETAKEYTFMYEHKNPYHKIHWGLGVAYFTGQVDFLTMKSLILKGGLTWAPIRSSLMNLEVYSNLNFSGDFRIASQDIGQYKGNLYGVDYGLAARFFPRSKLGVYLGVGGSYYRFNNLSAVVLTGGTQSAKFNTMVGTKAELGLSYRF